MFQDPGTYHARTALVTGASSGIGAIYAERLAKEGYDLIIVARRKDRLNVLAERLRLTYGRAVEVLVADLTHPPDLKRVEEKIASTATLQFLVNNAGIGGYMPFIQLDPDMAEELIRLHVVAITRLSRAALPRMVQQGQGAIVNVSSLLSFTATFPAPPLPYRTTYAACKSYINTFSQLLANEVSGSGVQVQVLVPGVVNTEFHEREGADVNRFPAHVVLRPEDVVEASLVGLQLGEVMCIPGLDDLALLEQQQQMQRQIFERSRTDTPASRYTGRNQKP